MIEKLKYVFVGAHPDDIEIASGGLVAKLLENKAIVKFVVVTDGEYVSGTHTRTKETAIKEQCIVADKYGIDLALLGKKIGNISRGNEIVSELEKEIYGFDVVVTHNLNELHNEHELVSRITMEAARNVDRVAMWQPYALTSKSGRSISTPNLYVELTEDQLAKKIDMIKMHSTEHKRKSCFVEDAEKYALYNGIFIKSRPAEGFNIVRWRW